MESFHGIGRLMCTCTCLHFFNLIRMGLSEIVESQNVMVYNLFPPENGHSVGNFPPSPINVRPYAYHSWQCWQALSCSFGTFPKPSQATTAGAAQSRVPPLDTDGGWHSPAEFATCSGFQTPNSMFAFEVKGAYVLDIKNSCSNRDLKRFCLDSVLDTKVPWLCHLIGGALCSLQEGRSRMF